MGTLVGLKTDIAGRALDHSGRPIAGLYAVGNDMANVFGGACPGGGITLGPGMTFAHLAAQHMAGHPIEGIVSDEPQSLEAMAA
jgi:predicted oxidoreductase